MLDAISAPTSQANVNIIVAWERAESGNDWNAYVPQKVPTKFNPLNAIQQESDSTDTNGPGSPQAYTDWADGLRATVVTLLADDYGYPAIVTALKKGNQPIAVYEAVVASNWGTKQDFYSWYGQGYVYKQPPWNQP